MTKIKSDILKLKKNIIPNFILEVLRTDINDKFLKKTFSLILY